MPFSITSGWIRLAAGLAALATGIGVFVTSPGIAFAHHLELTQLVDCYAWSIRSEYIGGTGDRKVVVDVTINGDHIFEEFYFDNAPGHLGHPASYVVLDESGSGSVAATGTVKMYEKQNGAYVDVADVETISANLVCATPTATATATPTSTPEATATNTPVPTNTSTPTSVPQPTETPGIAGTVTPLPTHTPETPATATPPATGGNNDRTPETSATPPATSTPATGEPASTPTFVDEVRGSTPPAGPDIPTPPAGETGTLFPDTGNGGARAAGLLAALLGLTLAATGLATIAHGLRRTS